VESLVKVASGDENVAIGISGFGSAQIGVERWEDLARVTGRTTFYLQYDSQSLPWPDGAEMILTTSIYTEMVDRWADALKGGLLAARYLATWLTRWAQGGRKILVVGFSLGGQLAWKAVQLVPDELKGQIELILLSAAVGDRKENWKGLEHLSRVVNGYSSLDLALIHMYAHVADTSETPAAGLGPLIVSPPNLDNVDMTDMVGWNHLWGSENIMRLIRIALGCVWAEGLQSVLCPDVDEILAAENTKLSGMAADRLYRWTLIDPELWRLLGRALDGDPAAIVAMRRLDVWSLERDRLSALIDSGSTVMALGSAKHAPGVADRSRRVLKGLLRSWLSEDFNSPSSVRSLEQAGGSPEQVLRD